MPHLGLGDEKAQHLNSTLAIRDSRNPLQTAHSDPRRRLRGVLGDRSRFSALFLLVVGSVWCVGGSDEVERDVEQLGDVI